MQLLSLSCVICISGEPRRYTQRASGRDGEKGGERKKERLWSLMYREREREKRLRNRRGKGGKEGEETHCHRGTHMTERMNSGEIKVRDRGGKTKKKDRAK